MNNICDNCGGKLKKEIEIKSFVIKCQDCKKEFEITQEDRNLNSGNKNSVDILSKEIVKNSIYNNLYPIKRDYKCPNCKEESIRSVRIPNKQSNNEFYTSCGNCFEITLLNLTK